MKILAIRLKNLASLAGPFEIDFTAEPLASAGLFAITGPTGAGKSTLLDALCLALFGAVPRLSNIGRETKLPEIDSDILTSDPRTLLRRGTGSGFAEVDFVGLDGRRYRARWEANRARDKANGKLQGSRQSLHDLDSEQLLSNQSKGEYKQLIEACLGLNFEQFTRAVMLAQSEFSAFLKADDKDRSELLEKLTNTAIYSQLGRRAYSKSKEAEDAHKALQDQAAGVMPMAPEARAELDQRYAGALEHLKGEQAQLRQLELQRAWLTELKQLQAQVHSSSEQLRSVQQHSDSLQGERLNLARLEHLAPQRHQFARLQTLGSQLSPLAASIRAQRLQHEALQAGQHQLQTEQQLAQQALAEALAQQAERAPLLRQAFTEQNSLTRLSQELANCAALKQQAEQASAEGQQQLASLSEQQRLTEERLTQISEQLTHSAALAGLGDAWNAYRDRLQQLMQLGNRLNQGRAELPGLQARTLQANTTLDEQRAAIALLYREAQAEPDALAEQIGLLGELLQKNRQQQRQVEDLSRLWHQQQDLEQRLTALRERQQAALKQREQLISEGLNGKNQLTAAEQALNITRQLLERQRLARSQSVEELRAQLQDDQPCPVCGSQEHPYHQPEALLQSLGRHDQDEEHNALQQVDALKKQLDELRTQLGGVNGQIKEYLHQQEQLAEQLQRLAPSVQAQPLYADLAGQDSRQQSAWLELQERRLADDISRDEQRQNALLTLQKDAARLQQQLQAAIEASQQASQHLSQQQQALDNDEQRLEQELASFATVLPADVLDDLRREPTDTFLRLDQQLAQRMDLVQRHKDEQLEHSERQQALDKAQVLQEGRGQKQQELQQQFTEFERQQHSSQTSLSGLLGEHAGAEQWQQHLEQAVEQARQQEALKVRQLQETQAQLIELTTELKAKDERLIALEQEHGEVRTQIEQWRQRHPELDDSGLEQLLALDDNAVAQLRQRLQDSEKALEQAQVLLNERQQRLDQHQALVTLELPEDELEQSLEVLQGQLANSEQHCAELRAEQADDQRRQQANQALAEQITQAYGEWQRWARLNALIGSATGDTFRKIAQGYNLDLLVHHANAQLRQLARRYRLKRGGSLLGLLVLDTEMGDELRSVHSLSGGETFLVSLALALGLASMASSTLRIESLFIDEGFGSLDPESLQLAMDALDGLQAQGRKVAVISHVQEMHERIPVQIQVRRQGNGLSSVEVSG
ncbi:chromosome segregation protein SMC [Pseudomonas alkylphenolica]|uniref:Nuclease SbcCD subunit C n=1 Tax=Pseudomonas alkylphenolica TaxID=237609 RepID=A0A443ZGL9_9PSED|nr:AAA family ATPase [Pseudomonas alkylphenolica]RWU17957.1 chromosome segregation protein SMC [Pseudomonas alkylphenolica]